MTGPRAVNELGGPVIPCSNLHGVILARTVSFNYTSCVFLNINKINTKAYIFFLLHFIIGSGY